MKGSFEGKLALVTGSGSGIGRATAEALANEGARLIVVDVDEESAKATAAALGSKCVMTKRVDVSKKDEMRALADEVHATLGALDILVNNAGVGHSGGMLDSTLEDWQWIINVNLWGVIYGCHYFVPKMVARGGGGHVANVASGLGLVASPTVGPYCTTKFAVVGLSESLRAELAPKGIGVSAVCPGVINTDIVARGRFADESQRKGAVKLFKKRGHSPAMVARAILKGIQRNDGIIVAGAEVWAAWAAKRLAPSLLESVAGRFEKLARSQI